MFVKYFIHYLNKIHKTEFDVDYKYSALDRNIEKIKNPKLRFLQQTHFSLCLFPTKDTEDVIYVDNAKYVYFIYKKLVKHKKIIPSNGNRNENVIWDDYHKCFWSYEYFSPSVQYDNLYSFDSLAHDAKGRVPCDPKFFKYIYLFPNITFYESGQINVPRLRVKNLNICKYLGQYYHVYIYTEPFYSPYKFDDKVKLTNLPKYNTSPVYQKNNEFGYITNDQDAYKITSFRTLKMDPLIQPTNFFGYVEGNSSKYIAEDIMYSWPVLESDELGFKIEFINNNLIYLSTGGERVCYENLTFHQNRLPIVLELQLPNFYPNIIYEKSEFPKDLDFGRDPSEVYLSEHFVFFPKNQFQLGYINYTLQTLPRRI